MQMCDMGGAESFKMVSSEKTVIFKLCTSGSALSAVYLSSLFLRWEGTVRGS